MNTWKVILATLVIFGTGVITGGLLVSYSDRALRPRVQRPAPAPNFPGPPGAPNAGFPRENRLPAPLPIPLRKEFVERLGRELKLTPAQRERIEQIVSEGQERTRQSWQQVEPRMRRELAEISAQIRGELTSEQRGRFEELMRQRPRDQRRPLPPRERPFTNLPSDVNAVPAR